MTLVENKRSAVRDVSGIIPGAKRRGIVSPKFQKRIT